MQNFFFNKKISKKIFLEFFQSKDTEKKMIPIITEKIPQTKLTINVIFKKIQTIN